MGDPELDHQCWERPEAIRGIRPLTQANTSFPGTEVAAETAAMASASLVFKKIDKSYSNLLLEHAQQLFSFADAYRAKDLSCLKHVAELNGQQFADWGNPSWFSWDDKHPGTQQKGMPSEENLDLQMYRKTSEAIMCELLPDSPTATTSRTKGGLPRFQLYIAMDNSTVQLICAILAFHRGASIPADANTTCKDGLTWLESINSNPNVAVRAVLGGPFLNETCVDSRNNWMQAEPTTVLSLPVSSPA
ncbi:hypothetical protein OIU84_006093 [Salix udensis]|uniref:cellulase n=1 Tax=Salix udensis TaxID=889485 RepID=A0AAD6JZY5_9ROSI|nr:hypothetical protein OIU84_006093 [Salix udensis]